MAVLAFVLVACGSDDDATEAGATDDGGAEETSTSVTEAADTSADDHADDEADGHEDEDADADHDDEDHGEDADADHDDEGHDGEDTHDDHDDDDGSSGGLGAHEHGAAELSVAWGEGEVVVDLISPTHNIFGFEHEPSTDEDREVVEDRTDALTGPGVLVFNEEAGCELADEVATELEYEGSHAELTASWLFSCEHPDEIAELDVAALFAEFPNLEDIDAQWASPSGQSAAELSPSETVLNLG